MSNPFSRHEEAEQPSAHPAEPHHVVLDGSLSNGQKAAALDQIEQDHRQRMQAASEGMEGSESTKLHDVLGAKDALAEWQVVEAYRTVLQDLEFRYIAETAPATRELLDHAIIALKRLAALKGIAAFPAR
jgi:hypothetical protein